MIMPVSYVSGKLSSYIVGRASESDLVLADSFVSRRHLILTSVTGDAAVIEVLGRNGAEVYARKVDKGYKGYVRAGDPVKIGRNMIVWTGDTADDGVFIRTGRSLPGVDTSPVEIEGPPPRKVPEKPSVMLAAGPALTMAVPILLGAGRSIAILSSVFAFIWAAANVTARIRKQRSEEKRRRNTYIAYLTDCENTIKMRVRQASNTLNRLYPPVARYFAAGPDPLLLWNRDSSAGTCPARIGTGTIENPVPVLIPKERFAGIDDSLKELPGLIREKYQEIAGAPVMIAPDEKMFTVFELNDDKDIMILASFILQLCVSYPPEDLHLMIDVSDRISERLGWCAFLPHYVSDGPCGEEGPLTVSVTDDMGKGYMLMSKGYRVILLQDPVPDLPAGIAFTANRTDGSHSIEYDMIPGCLCHSYAKMLAGLQKKSFLSENSPEIVPENVPFSDMLEGRRSELCDAKKLGSRICSVYAQNDITSEFSAPIGMASSSEKVILDLHEKAAGPHGLVAGTTGSGKSELLTTVILSFAARYPADKLAFFLIDYKGGGMSNLFEGLPHLLGSISNLSRSEAQRAMKALKSENLRRQKIFANCRVNNINDYTRLYDKKAADIPLPHILVIIDEFAELKREEPEFMDSLISVSQVGRSLGIHLILATQKPAGVIDEKIRANSGFRIALRLMDRSDSMDLIRRADAAAIKECGRAYLQIGNEEGAKLFQSAYAMSHALASGKIRVYEDPFMKKEITGSRGKTEDRGTWFDITLSAVKLADEKLNVPKPLPLWLPALPGYIEDEDAFAVFDNPYEQKYEKAAYEPEKCGHMLVTGKSASGKSELLLSAMTHTDEAAVYVIDFGGGRLERLKNLSVCGGYVTEGDEADIIRMTGFICEILAKRKRSRERVLRSQSVILLLDDISAIMKAAGEEFEEHLTSILTFGRAYGIFVLATRLTGGLLRQERLFDTYLFLGNEDIFIVSAMLRAAARDIPSVEEMPGRGVGLWDKVPLEFMTVKSKEISDRSPPQEKTVPHFPSVPKRPILEDLLKRADKAETQLPIGFAEKTGKLFHIPIGTLRCFLIAGRPYTGRHTLFFNISVTAALYDIKTIRADTYESFILSYRQSGARAIIAIESISTLLGDFYAGQRTRNEEEELAECFSNPLPGRKDTKPHPLVVGIIENDTPVRYSGRIVYDSMAKHAFGMTLGGGLDEVRFFDYSYLPFSVIQKTKRRCVATVGGYGKNEQMGDVIIPEVFSVDNSQSP